jgi:uncharacterized protein affecting Mg2+/Co2+ transport
MTFVLQFSTGDSVAVTGTGIVGRAPSPQPGEYFDHVVPVVDVGRTLSKTHLEFGELDGTFWVSDRFSGNGTRVEVEGRAPRRCEPGKRVMVPRGGRVVMGDQFFTVL